MYHDPHQTWKWITTQKHNLNKPQNSLEDRRKKFLITRNLKTAEHLNKVSLLSLLAAGTKGEVGTAGKTSLSEMLNLCALRALLLYM